ncbi:MAG: peptidoglycan DD-metalloendopeptidase family protein [Ignavibacteriales bacterium]|nr:peptidoglycan DD-metalloendopeptidase family protein [Ignavibacteriales bacterium]
MREKIAAEKTAARDARATAASSEVADAQVVAGQARPGRARDRPADQDPGRRAEAAASRRRAGLEKLIAELRKALAAGQPAPVAQQQAPFEPLRGKLPWPVQQGKVLARFGQPRAGGSLRWQGMLIGTERGARVRAPFAGRVAYADWLPGMGLMIVLDHGGGYLSLYGHNEELFRKVGEPGRGRRRDRRGRRLRRPQPAGAVFRGAARPRRRSTRRTGCSGASSRRIMFKPATCAIGRAAAAPAQTVGARQGMRARRSRKIHA